VSYDQSSECLVEVVVGDTRLCVDSKGRKINSAEKADIFIVVPSTSMSWRERSDIEDSIWMHAPAFLRLLAAVLQVTYTIRTVSDVRGSSR